MKAKKTPVQARARARVQPKLKPKSRPTSVSEKEIDEQTDEPKAERGGFLALLVVGVLILGITAALAASRKLTGWEYTFLMDINGMSLPGWVTAHIAKPISNAVWGILGLIFFLLLVPKFRLRAWQYLVAGGSAFMLNFIVEHLVDRARPVALTSDVIMRAAQDGPGFPSGHVAVLAAICGVLWLLVSWPWRILLVLFVVAEAWSRLYLGVHAPLDVIGSIGVACIVIAALHLLPIGIRTKLRLYR